MSVIDTTNNTITSYVSGTTKPLNGQRLASFNWKIGTNKDSLWFGIKRESKAVSIPQIAATEIAQNLSLLTPHIIGFLAGVQDKIIRAALEANDSLLHVSNESIGIAAILEYLEDSDESGRLTKESVGVWFDGTIADSLSIALADKMGISENPTDAQDAQIAALCAQFRTKITGLAGGKTSYPVKLAQSLQKVIALAPSEDVLGVRFNARLQKMIEVTESVDLYDAL